MKTSNLLMAQWMFFATFLILYPFFVNRSLDDEQRLGDNFLLILLDYWNVITRLVNLRKQLAGYPMFELSSLW